MSDGNTNDSVYIQKLFTSRDNFTQGNVQEATANTLVYVGNVGRIWWNPVPNAFYYSDGNTPGGILITGGASGNGTVGGANTYVQYNNAGNFAGDPNFTFNSSTSTLSVTNIIANTITGGAGGANTQVLFNDSGNINGNAQFTFNKASNVLTMTGSAYLGNVYPSANNISNLGSATARFNDLWLGSGNINLVDDTLNINQEINAVNGNLVISGGNGIVFGQFAMYGNTIATQNPTANINIGLIGDTAYVDIERPLSVNSTGGGLPAFVVEQNGVTEIRSYGNIASNTALLLINGTTSGNGQARNFEGTLIQATAQGNTPARMSADAFGVDGTGQNAYASWAARVARGTVDAPSQTLAGDTMFRFTSQGYSNSGAYIGSIIRYNQVALENFATGKAGTRHNFAASPVGTATIKNIANIDGNGITFSSVAAGGPANIGITFQDGSYQNTAYLPSSVVRSLTAGAGIGLSASVGNITITNTGVLGVTGTTNQINVANVGNVLTLSLPQNLNTTANVILNQLTVNDLVILGNVSNVIPSVVGGKIIYVANTATNFSGINTSGLVTGNIGNSVWAGILYNTDSNTWQMDIGNSVGITSDIIYSTEITANGNIHLGNAYNDYDFTEALLQGDTSVDSYSQLVLKNHYQGANASADIVAVANNGDDTVHYIDMGINSNVYANADYAVTGYNDGYLYVNGGNLVIGTQTASNVINFFTGGTDNLNKIRGTISDTGLSMVGNVTANNMISVNATIGGIVSASGNITGGNLVTGGQVVATGNIAGLNVNTGIISASGNITGANIRTAGSISTTANVLAGNLIVTGLISAAGNINAANVAAGNITSAIISATGNISGPNITATILSVSATLNVTGNITGGNLLFGSGIVSGTGNVAAGYFLGDGGQLSNISVAKIANGTTQVNIPTASGNANITVGGTSNVAVFSTTGEYINGIVSVSGNIISAANVSGGNLKTGGLITATANIIGGNLVGQNLTAGRVAVVGSGKEVADDADFTYNSTTNVLSVAGNVNASFFNGNVVSSGNISTTGNVIGGNILTTGIVSVTGNVTGNYVIASGGNTVINAGISTTGNVTGNYFIGNGSQLTGVLTTITPNALSSTVHVAAVTTGNVANIISDATTANTANTIVVRDQFGGINVGSWTIHTHLTATNYTATSADYWIGLTNKTLTITLPNAANGAVDGRQYIIADTVQSGNPGDSIATQAGATVVGGTLTQQGQAKMCVYVESTATWYCN